jgi:hypothetical protein
MTTAAASTPAASTDVTDAEPAPPDRRPAPSRWPIRPTLAEVRRLFHLRDQGRPRIHEALRWSTYRRRHQGEARWYHARRRLRIQSVAA